MYGISIYLHFRVNFYGFHVGTLEPKWPLFLKANPSKQGLNSNQNKGLPGKYTIVPWIRHGYLEVQDTL